MRARSRDPVPVLVALLAAVAMTALLVPALLPGPWPGPSLGPGPGDVQGATSADGAFRVWAVDAEGRTVRWDPCTAIALVVEPSAAPAGALEDLTRAIAMLAEAGGPRLVVEGTTDERPSVERPPHQPERYGERWAPVLVAWALPGATDLPLGATDRGLALPTAVRVDGVHAFVTGQVVLNAARTDLVAGFEDRSRSWGATILHELGHLVGLGHVEDPTELMSVAPGRGPVRLGPGDRTGLEHLADGGICAPAPRARAVPVVRTDRGDPAGVSPGR